MITSSNTVLGSSQISPKLLDAVKFDKTYFPIPIIESNEKSLKNNGYFIFSMV